jgi:VanZ family protein
VFLGLVVFGVFLEFLQALVPGRFAGADDALANTLGVFFGLALARFLQYRLRPL